MRFHGLNVLKGVGLTSSEKNLNTKHRFWGFKLRAAFLGALDLRLVFVLEVALCQQ